MTTTRLRRAALLLGLAVVGSTQGVVAGTPPPAPITVREAPVGVAGALTDLTADDGAVIIGWEEREGSNVEARYAGSYDAGVSYRPEAVLSEHTGARADACSLLLFLAGVTGYPTVLGGRGIELANGSDSRRIEASGTDYLRPDVACVDHVRIALVVLVRRPAGTRLIMWIFRPDLDDGAPSGFDLGPANRGVSPVVAASAGWIHVAWMSGRSLLYKRFQVGEAALFPVTPKPTQVIESTSGQGGPVLGVDGRRVVLAWQRKGSVVARVSVDRGRHFRARKTLMQGSPATAKVAFATNADAQGSVLMVSGSVVSEGISAKGLVMTSTDDGAHWGPTWVFSNMVGFVWATLDATNSGTRIYATTDWRLADPTDGVHAISISYTDLP